jgi:hypothetical protein
LEKWRGKLGTQQEDTGTLTRGARGTRMWVRPTAPRDLGTARAEAQDAGLAPAAPSVAPHQLASGLPYVNLEWPDGSE